MLLYVVLVFVIDFREAFTLFVKTDEGNVSAKDLAIVMRAVGQNPTEAELTNMMREMNLDLGKMLSNIHMET
jgi:calmodulin